MKVALGLLVSCAFIWLIVRSIPVADVAYALSLVRPGPVVAAIGCFLVGYSFRILRWLQMLRVDNPDLTFGRAAIPFMISFAANNVLPLRAGDAMRTFGFTRWLTIPASKVLATLVVERLLDLLMLLVMLAVALSLLGLSASTASQLLGVGGAGLLVIACGVGLVLAFPRLFQPPILFVTRLIAARTGSIGQKVLRAVESVFDAMHLVVREGRSIGLIVYSILAWSAEALVFYCAALALPAIGNPEAAWLAMPVGTLSTLLPSSPGYVGTFDYFVMEAVEHLGNEGAAAAAFALVVHLILWVTATAVGGACFVLWSLGGARREIGEHHEPVARHR